MARFPPGKGGGEGVAYGRKGKGILIHRLTDGAGMPLSSCTTPANGDERAQVIPLLDTLQVRTGKPGRPHKRLKVLAADKGYDAKDLRRHLRTHGIRPWIPKRVCKSCKPWGRPIKQEDPCDQAERTFAWSQRKYCRLVVRWERLAACVNAFLAIAMMHIWVHRLTVRQIRGGGFAGVLEGLGARQARALPIASGLGRGNRAQKHLLTIRRASEKDFS
jgi:hypothetical protein